MNKITNKELFAKVLDVLTGETKDAFQEYVDKYNAKNAKVAAKRAEKSAEKNAEFADAVKAVLSKDTPMTRDAIVSAIGDVEIGGKKVTAGRVSSLLSKDCDWVNATKIKDGKSKKVAYTLA